MRIAGESEYELQAGESLDTAIIPNFRVMIGGALQSVPQSKPIRIRLMFEVEQ